MIVIIANYKQQQYYNLSGNALLVGAEGFEPPIR